MKLRIGSVLLCLLSYIPGALHAGDVELRPTPCRIFDSRHIGGLNQGPKVSSATIETTAASLDGVAFTSGGRNYNAQGGESGCRVKTASAKGAIFNVIVSAPESGGWARFWAFGETEPLSTSINAFYGAANEVAGIMVHLGAGGKVSLNASITGAHYIVDLSGALDGPGGPVEPRAPKLVRVLTFANAPIAGQEMGNRLIVSPGAVGPFDGHDNQYAIWKGIPSCDPTDEECWQFEDPVDGDLAYVSAPSGMYSKFRSSIPSWSAVDN